MTARPGDAQDTRPIVAARGLLKRYGADRAVGPLDLEATRGTALALLGPTGAGKTTIIRLLAGLLRRTSGSASIAGAEVGGKGWLQARARLGVLEADAAFYRWMTSRELVAFADQLCGLSRRERRSRVDDALARVGLLTDVDRRIDDYPVALRRRVGLAQAIVARPDVVLLDEPLAALDPGDRRELLALLADLGRETTLIYSTRTLDDVETVADRVVLLDGGRVALDVPISELLGRLAQPIYAVAGEREQNAALAALNARLRQEPWVDWTSLEGSTLRIAVGDATRAARTLLPLVVASGIRVASFGRVRPTLEDLLAELSRHGRPEDPAA